MHRITGTWSATLSDKDNPQDAEVLIDKMNSDYCEFCEIINGNLPSSIRYQDEDVLVFQNKLNWVPVMLLAVPREHMSQQELWLDAALISKIGALSVNLGNIHSPDGFRLLSNFGDDALQTQPHGHLHIVGGARLGLYIQEGDI